MSAVEDYYYYRNERRINSPLERRADAAIVELEAKMADLKERLERARSYKGIEAYPCPLCTYRDGIFIESCQMHKDMHELEATMRQDEHEAAFWEWLWENFTHSSDKGNDSWLAHMRERFEYASVLGGSTNERLIFRP